MQNIDPLEIANILATELWCQQVERCRQIIYYAYLIKFHIVVLRLFIKILKTHLLQSILLSRQYSCCLYSQLCYG